MMKKDVRKPETVKILPAAKMAAKIKRIFVREGYGLRIGWLLLLAMIVFRGVSYGVRIGLNTAFASLFSAWNVTSANIHRAPFWAQLVYSWHGSLITVAVGLLAVPVSLLMRRWCLKKGERIKAGFRKGLIPAGLGAGIGIVSAALFLIFDSMRLEWPVTEPDFTAGILLMLPVTLLTALSEELFTKAVVFDTAAARGKKTGACVLASLVFFFFNGGYAGTLVSGVNVLLMGAVCCMLYAQQGLWAAVLFRGMWSYVSVFILGFGANGATRTVYAIYSVSEAWLTGGHGGMIYGLWMTAVLLGIMAWMHRGAIAEFVRKVQKRTGGV